MPECIGELDLTTDDAVSFARTKLKVMAEGLGLEPIASTRLATAASEFGRRMIAQRRPAHLVVQATIGDASQLLLLEFRFPDEQDHEADDTRPLQAFFERVGRAGNGAIRCSLNVRQLGAWDEARLERARGLLEEKSRAELMRDLERQNRALERHRAHLEKTVEHRTEELRAAMRRAEEANRAKSQFLSHMSHELRTPLNGVLGHCQILQRDGDVNPRQRKSLAAIDSSGRHLLTLINDILDLSKIEAGEIDLEQAPCDLQALTLDVCNIVQPRAGQRDVVVRRVVASDVPRAIRTDPTKLRQCLVNIAGNAAKFTERGSIELRVNVSEGRVLFEIEDTGVGMTPEETRELFQPFKQARAGRAAGGTGLGLAISQRLVQRLGGELQVTSAVGRGSTFSFALPCVPATVGRDIGDSLAGPGARRHQHLAPGEHCAVLIVDDNKTNRDVLVSLLEPSGFEVSEADDGLAALEQMRARPYDLVLMDLRMPRMTGEEALKQIRDEPALADAKVIAITASIERGLMSQLESLGFDAVLGKPFRVDALFATIQRLTDLAWAPVTSSTDSPVPPPDQAPTEMSTKPAELLPTEQAQRLAPAFRQALVVGDLQALSEQAAQLESLEPPVKALGQRVRALCEAFDMQGLEQISRELEKAAEG